MKYIKAQKTAITEMIEVTREELYVLLELNPYISVGEYDKINCINNDGVIGYVAGDINSIQMHEKDMKITDSSVKDAWFINKEFFDNNYKII